MSVTSGFFNSLNGDRRYTAEQFSELINTLVNDGVFQNVGTAFSVTATSGNEITVGIGRCWFNGVWLMNDALYPMALRDSELLLNRIDAVVIEINHSESVRAGSIRLISGTPASDPQRPSLVKTDDIHQYPLAYIYRKAGVNEVTQADITNMVGTSECPYITGILETQDIDKVVAQWESQFNTWFEGIQDILDSDTAAKLASQIIEMDNRFETLARERAVYEELTDSNGEKIMDSNTLPIQARTVMAAEGSTASPNAIIPVMTDNSHKIGDILTTARTDLDVNWLLCNGEAIPRSMYPELSTLIPKVPEEKFEENTEAFSGITRISYQNPWRVKYVNGYVVILMNDYSFGSSYENAYILYAKDTGNGSLTFNKVKFSSTTVTGWSDYEAIRDIIYFKGYYIISIGSSACTFYYATSLSGKWTRKKVSVSGASSFYFEHMAASDTHIMFAGSESGAPVYGHWTAVTTDPIANSTFTGADPCRGTSIISTGDIYSTEGLTCINGTFIIIFTTNENSIGLWRGYTSNMSAPWSESSRVSSLLTKHSSEIDNTVPVGNIATSSDAGKVVAVGSYVTKNSDGSSQDVPRSIVWESTGPAGIYYAYENPVVDIYGNKNYMAFSITYIPEEDIYVLTAAGRRRDGEVGYEPVLLTSKVIEGPWKPVYLTDIEENYSSRSNTEFWPHMPNGTAYFYFEGIVFTGHHYVTAFSVENRDVDLPVKLFTLNTDNLYLPEISLSDKTYTYIKAGGA